MKQILHFLERLSRHNEREWFNAHKEEYVKAREGFTALTEQVQEGAKLLDLCLMDHLIIGDQTYYSFKERGLIQ